MSSFPFLKTPNLDSTTTIVANNWILWWENTTRSEQYIVDQMRPLYFDATARSENVLLYVTEVTEKLCTLFDKKFSSQELYVSKQVNNDWNHAVLICNKPSPIISVTEEKYNPIFHWERDESAFIVEWHNYVWSFQHFSPYALSKSKIMKVLGNWNKERSEMFNDIVFEVRQMRNEAKKVNDNMYEFHTWYRNMYWSVLLNLIVWLWNRWEKNQNVFLDHMKEYWLSVPEQYPTWKYSYIWKKYASYILFKWINSLVSDNVKNNTTVSIIEPNPYKDMRDRATIITDINN